MEFKNTFYPDFCQMLKEQGRKNLTHTRQIINSLLYQNPKMVREKYCPTRLRRIHPLDDAVDVVMWDFTNYDELIKFILELEKRTDAILSLSDDTRTGARNQHAKATAAQKEQEALEAQKAWKADPKLCCNHTVEDGVRVKDVVEDVWDDDVDDMDEWEWGS